MPYEWKRYGQSFIPVCFRHMKELKMQNAVSVGSVLEPSKDAGPFVNMKDSYWRERNRMMFRCHCSCRFCEWTTGNSSVSESAADTFKLTVPFKDV